MGASGGDQSIFPQHLCPLNSEDRASVAKSEVIIRVMQNRFQITHLLSYYVVISKAWPLRIKTVNTRKQCNIPANY